MNKEIHNQSKDPEQSIKVEAKSSVSKDKESKDRKQETKKESPQEEIALLKIYGRYGKLAEKILKRARG